MSFYLKNDDDDLNHQSSQSGSNSPALPNNSHKQNSLRNTKLARRARSFKDDVIGTILKVRSPNINTLSLGRSHSPNSPRNKLSKGNHSLCSTDGGDGNHKPLHDLNYHVRQVKNALQHFKGVVSRNRLEVLPANGTVVLETIANVHTALQPYTLNENSSAIISATTQVYLSLGKLIKLCDEVLLSEDDTNCASLSQENVTEVVELVEKAVQNLVQLANEKMSEREKNGGTLKPNATSSNLLQRPEVNTSLPDIPLTPRERDILEQSQSKNLRTSHSIESILRDSSPPPKPPLPERSSNPPPLPPKRKIPPKPVGIQLSSSLHQQAQSVTDLDSSNNIDTKLLNCGLDRISLRSKSPDDNSSLLSTSSLDSALNHSREEDELKALTCNDQNSDEITLREDIDKFFEQKGNNCTRSEVTDSIGPIASITELTVESRRNPRESQESGFVSMHSIRASMQSVTKRQSTEQHRESLINSSTILGGKSLTVANMSIMNNSAQTITANTKTTSNFSNEIGNNVTKTVNSAMAKKSIMASKNENYVHMGNYDMLSFNADSLDGHDNHVIAMRMTNKKSIEHRLFSNSSTSSTFEFNDDDCIAEDDEVPPALPMKSGRPLLVRRNRMSTYDNVDEADEFRNHMMFIPMNHSKHQSLFEPRRIDHFGDESDQPPPLPVKKNHNSTKDDTNAMPTETAGKAISPNNDESSVDEPSVGDAANIGKENESQNEPASESKAPTQIDAGDGLSAAFERQVISNERAMDVDVDIEKKEPTTVESTGKVNISGSENENDGLVGSPLQVAKDDAEKKDEATVGVEKSENNDEGLVGSAQQLNEDGAEKKEDAVVVSETEVPQIGNEDLKVSAALETSSNPTESAIDLDAEKKEPTTAVFLADEVNIAKSESNDDGLVGSSQPLVEETAEKVSEAEIIREPEAENKPVDSVNDADKTNMENESKTEENGKLDEISPKSESDVANSANEESSIVGATVQPINDVTETPESTTDNVQVISETQAPVTEIKESVPDESKSETDEAKSGNEGESKAETIVATDSPSKDDESKNVENEQHKSSNSTNESKSNSQKSESKPEPVLGFARTGFHPLFSRILLSARPATPVAPMAPLVPTFQLPLLKPGLLPMFKLPSAPIPRKHVKREAAEEDIFVTPKAYQPLEPITTTRRPLLIEKFHAMSSAEKAEKISSVLEKIMHGVTIVSHVDGYITNRTKSGFKKIHKLFASSEETTKN